MTIYDDIKNYGKQRLSSLESDISGVTHKYADQIRAAIYERREILDKLEEIKHADRDELQEIAIEFQRIDNDETTAAIENRFEELDYADEVEETDRNTAAYSYSVR
jgi:hypothetical protein